MSEPVVRKRACPALYSTLPEHFRSTFVTISATRFKPGDKEDLDMSEFEAEVKKAERELEQSLVPLAPEQSTGSLLDDEFLGDLKMQAQEYGQKLQDAASKAKDFAGEKFAQAGDRFKELQSKDPKELVEDAKEFARQKPGQTILISAAIGLVVGFLLKGRK
ncbi:MAG: hypothetical protein ABIO91_02210 [Pyrinomonadaceae bacterium]